ncbi:phage major tail tube protein [Novosphingobium rosa]|uniref:phage major tail tube protein n=1 Tax=Novosphingobium rosa TaxID=76978 RepID=UPI000829F259|nr:phage major tail tube protein [Novosphingobium rosa]
MGFPSVLKDMILFDDGESQQGEVPECTIPKLALKLEEWFSGGMLAPLDITMGIDKLVFEYTHNSLNQTTISGFGLPAFDGKQLRFAGAYQEDGSGDVQAVEVISHGKVTELDFGTQKKGTVSTVKRKMTCAYYELNVDGVNWITIDVLNNVFLVMGKDMTAAIRAALGIS